MNTYTDFDFLADQMVASFPESFTEFAGAVSELVPEWLQSLGLTPAAAEAATPECIMSLALLIVRRRKEIPAGRVLNWLRMQTRNIYVKFWREADERDPSSTVLTAGRAAKIVNGLNGTWKNYRRVARQFGVRAGWLRQRHREMEARRVATAGGTTTLSE
jgi:hypothetical protein